MYCESCKLNKEKHLHKLIITLKALYHRLKIALKLIRNGNLKPVLKGFFKRIYSSTNFIGLEATPLDLKISNSKIDIAVRPFENTDINSLNEKFRHARLVEEQIPNCYVAITNDAKTIYRQWLFTHNSQQQVLDYFGPVFPKINHNEAIVEGIFTHPEYRGLRIMSNAMVKIIHQPQYKNLSRIIAFVDEQNISSLKGFYRIGFTPYLIRKEVWFLFRRKVTFLEISTAFYKNLIRSMS